MQQHRALWGGLRILTAALLAVLALGGPSLARPAAADDHTVGDGTALSCTTSELNDTLALVQNSGGGQIDFDCGLAPQTIVISPTLVITENVAFEGGHLGNITLSGDDDRRLFVVESDGLLTLNDLVLTQGTHADGYGGCILVTSAWLVTNNSLIHTCRVGIPFTAALDGGPYPIIEGSTAVGGAIANVNGVVLMGNTQVLSSTADTGGGIYSSGALGLYDSRIAFNRARYDGGGLVLAGEGFFSGSVIEHNRADNGGGVYSYGTSALTFAGGQVYSNTADVKGGGIHAAGYLSFTHSSFEENVAATDGGALYVYSGTAELDQARVLGNRAYVGGGVFIRDGAITVTTSIVHANVASDGGGIANDGGRATLANVTISYNQAGADGGGFYDTGPLGWSELTNVTFSGNSAGTVAGGIKSVKPLTMTNVTIANNTSGSSGAGFYRTNATYPYHLLNVLLANNTVNAALANCGGSLIMVTENLSDDLSCNFFLGGNANLPLGPLTGNGGTGGWPMPTHMLLAGNDAIDSGENVGCPSTDQRGAPRPAGSACDMGAVETAAAVPLLWLPLIVR